MTLLQDRVLAIIADRPGVTLAELREALPDWKKASVIRAVARLRNNGRIELDMTGVYVPIVQRTSAVMLPEDSSGDQFIQPVPLSRRMARR